jgi:excisionase family DNA binding protein
LRASRLKLSPRVAGKFFPLSTGCPKKHVEESLAESQLPVDSRRVPKEPNACGFLSECRTGRSDAALSYKVTSMAILITVKNFCDEYGVSRSTAYRLRDRGELRHVKIGRAVRIRREDAERWYESLQDDAAND